MSESAQTPIVPAVGNDGAPVNNDSSTLVRRKGRPAIDDAGSLRRMDEVRHSGQASTDWAAARIAASAISGHSYEANVWRLYKKFRQSKAGRRQ